jgi:hypothetical protein
MKMQFMMIVKSSRGCEAGNKTSDDVISAVGKYTQELRKAGVLVELSRLHPSSKAARVKLSKGVRIVTDGPFTETKELVGGYWIIETKSMEEAVEWAKRVPILHGESEESEIEIRQFLEVEYFVPGETVDPALAAGKESAKARAQKQS